MSGRLKNTASGCETQPTTATQRWAVPALCLVLSSAHVAVKHIKVCHPRAGICCAQRAQLPAPPLLLASTTALQARFNSIATNQWLDILPSRKVQAEQHGQDCFDQDFYIAANKYDLAFMAQQPDPKAAAWQHFLNMGIGEGRPHRYLC